MGTVIDYLMLWRSFPCILAYSLSSFNTRKKINEDLRAYGYTSGAFALHKALLRNKTFRRLFYTRLLKESRVLYSCRVCYRPLLGLEISTTTGVIGGGMVVYHGYSTIVFCHSIGSNFTVYQNVTLGRGKMVNGIDVPVIGNNVTIYAGAIVIGGIHIGDNVTIGAGAVVVDDVPAGVTVVGQANRIINHGEQQ